MNILVLSAALAAVSTGVCAQTPSDSLDGGVRHIGGVEVTARRIDRTVRETSLSAPAYTPSLMP